MIDQKRAIAVVPARKNSKGVRDKNIKLLGGKPLLAWSIEVALKTPQLDRVLVSTDGSAIAGIATQCGAEVYLRSAELAGDASLIVDTIRDLRVRLRAEGENAPYMVLLEPTSPLRHVDDVTACLRLLASGCDSVATFTEASLNPHRAWKIEGDLPKTFIDGADPWLPRQKQPGAWELNGAVYAFDLNTLPDQGISLLYGKVGAVRMSRSRSLDIDDERDFRLAELMLRDGE